MAALQILTFPFMLLNIFGVLAGAIWLAIIGQWAVLGIGLLSMCLSAPVIGFALMPGTLINLAAAPFLGTRLWFLGFPFLLAGSIYSAAIIGAWCFGVVVFFVQKGGADATLPALLWAYGVAISPLSYMTQRSSGPDGAGFGDVLITFAAQLAVVFMAIDVLAKGLDFDVLVYLSAGTMIVAALMQATLAFLVMRESGETALSDVA
jgi:hypothetical protein